MHITIRGDKADEILERGLKVKDRELRKKNFSETGKPFFTQVASDSVFNNTLIWVWSMIPSLVFSVWTSTSSLSALEAELDLEEDANPPLEPSTEFQRKMLLNGSRENTMELSTTDLYLNHIKHPYLCIQRISNQNLVFNRLLVLDISQKIWYIFRSFVIVKNLF